MLKLLTIISLLFFLFSCGTTYYLSGSFYEIAVDSYGDYNIKNKRFYVKTGMNNLDTNDLSYSAFKKVIEQSLFKRGAILSDKPENSDFVVLIQFGISDPEIYQENISIPVYGKTTIASAQTNTSTSNRIIGNKDKFIGVPTESTNSSTEFIYNYGVKGYKNETVTRTRYYRFCNLYAYNTSGKKEMLWKTNISSLGSSGDLRSVLKFLLLAGMDYYGVSSNGIITRRISDSDSNKQYFDNTKLTTTPSVIYYPRFETNADLTKITEVRFENDRTRIFFRIISTGSGEKFWIDQDIILASNGKRIKSIATNSVYSPNNIQFNRKHQLFNFYIDFPALDQDKVDELKIYEPSGGWYFDVFLK